MNTTLKDLLASFLAPPEKISPYGGNNYLHRSNYTHRSSNYSSRYSSRYSSNYAGDHTHRSSNYAGDHTHRSSNYSSNYAGDHTHRSSNYTTNNTHRSSNYSSNYAGDHTHRSSNYSSDFTHRSSNYTTNNTHRSSNYSSNYGADYSSNYGSNYTSNFTYKAFTANLEELNIQNPINFDDMHVLYRNLEKDYEQFGINKPTNLTTIEERRGKKPIAEHVSELKELINNLANSSGNVGSTYGDTSTVTIPVTGQLIKTEPYLELDSIIRKIHDNCFSFIGT